MGTADCGFILVLLYSTQLVSSSSQLLNPSRAWPCPSEDLISPCTCDPNFVSITCDAALFQSASEIQSVFTQPFPNNTMNMMTINNLHFPLVSDLLVDKQTRRVYLECRTSNSLSVDVDAFRVSSPVLYLFDVFNCDLTETDLSFLGSLPELTTLYIRYSSMNSFNGFPLLPKLHSLFIANTSIESWYETWLTPSLTNVSLYAVEASVVTKLLPALANYNLGYLQLASDRLTEIPPEIRGFTALRDLQMWDNDITRLRGGDLAPASNLEFLSFANCPIESIDSDFFQGDFRGTTVQLDFTQLSTLDRDVFYPLLSSMANGPGHIEIHGTPLECGCDLSWLIRDSPSFIPDVTGAECYNGTKIEELNPDDFVFC